jgi:hypothetical protein
MDPHPSVLTEIETLLDHEREAITRADAARVLDIAQAKKQAMDSLMASDIPSRPEFGPRIEALTKRLRDNLVLLVHARACVTEVLQTFAERPATYHTSTSRLPKGARISVTG